MAIAGVALLVLCGVLLLVRRSQQSRLFEIMTTETTTTKALIDAAKYVAERLGEIGSFNRIVEVKGTIKCGNPITSEIAQQPCVYYEMSVTREYEESYWDTDARTRHRRQRIRRGSETVASNSQRVPFWVEDATGRILIEPDHAEIDPVQVVDRFEPGEQRGSRAIGFGDHRVEVGGFLSGSGRRTLGYRFREKLLPLDRRVYVLGEASDASGELAIRAPREKGKRFIISLKSEEELIRSSRSTVRWLLAGSVVSGILGAVLILAGMLGQ